MTLTVHEVEQRSDEWLDLRTGIATASVVGQLVTTKARTAIDFTCPACEAVASEACKSKRTDAPIATMHPERTAVAKADTSPPVLTLADGQTVRDLAAYLAAERIAGIDPDGTFVNRDMWRGISIEEPARKLYAKHFGVTVTECGFLVRDEGDYKIGVSPDGLVGDDGGLEIKSPRQRGHLLTAVSGVVPAAHMAQIQTALLVSGRAWWDFMSYSPGMKPWVKRVLPDPDWFLAIHAAVAELETTIARLVDEYMDATAAFPVTDRLPDPNLVELTL